MLGYPLNSYEAYCLDEAIWYFCTIVTSEMEKAGQKKVKGQAQTEAARQRVLMKYLSEPGSTTGQYADPAALFNSQ